jgi:hypothetical protein
MIFRPFTARSVQTLQPKEIQTWTPHDLAASLTAGCGGALCE